MFVKTVYGVLSDKQIREIGKNFSGYLTKNLSSKLVFVEGFVQCSLHFWDECNVVSIIFEPLHSSLMFAIEAKYPIYLSYLSGVSEI